MSLIRQVWLLIMGTIMLACAGSVLMSVRTARQSLETQLSVKNNDNAQSMAFSLSQQGGDRALLELAIASQFDTGHYEAIILRSARGEALVSRMAPAGGSAAPDWFIRLVPMAARPGTAQVSNGWQQIGTLEVRSQAAFVYGDLWATSVRIVLWTLAVGVAAAAIGHLAVTRLRRQLDAVMEQANALTQRRFVTVDEPDTPELRRVVRAMNLMVSRLNQVFVEQAEQVEALRVQVASDPLTGVAHRRHFMAGFEARLASEEGGGATRLVLVRVLRLAEINRRLGHVCTDRLLRDIARVAGERDDNGVTPVLLGRLNGSDFALLYPTGVMGEDPARHLMARLQRLLADLDEVGVVGSSVGCRPDLPVARLLAMADLALADAESRGPFTYSADALEPPPIPGGENDWRRVLQQTLIAARVELRAFPVVDRGGRLMHLECPLRLQLQDDGPYEPAFRWLPLVLRTGLSCDADLAAIALVLTAIASDGQPRGVNVSPQSLTHPQFLPRLRSRVSAAGTAAARLWVEVDESALTCQPEAMAELCRQLRPFGVRLGLEHAGDRLSSIGVLLEAGLDYVKVASSWAVGLHDDPGRRQWLRSSTSMLHGVGLRVLVEGVKDPADLPALWACGIDGVTGPAIVMPAPAA